MRVLFLNRHDVMDEGRHSVGGLVEVFRSLSSALSHFGVTTLVYSEAADSKALQKPFVTSAGIKCYAGPFPKPRIFHLPHTFRPLASLCQHEKIDLIHAHGLYRNGWIALQMKHRLNIPYIITSHSDVFSARRGKRQSILRRYRHILEQAAGVTHLTPHMMHLSDQIYDTRHKSILIPNGIHIRSLQETPSEKKCLLALGRLVPEKGFHILIDAYATLCGQGSNQPALVIAGSGPAENALQEQARGLDLKIQTLLPEKTDDFPSNTIFFPGFVKGVIKQTLLDQCLLVLFPTQPTLWDEPFGIIQLEAMAAGKPLIASDMAAVRHVESMGLQSIRVKADDPVAWSAAIQSLLNQPDRRRAMGRQNFATVQAFDWPVIARQYADFYASRLI